MKYYSSMQELVGNTPLVRLGQSGFPETVQVFAKLEMMNPGGSVKDRIGQSMIEAAERDGTLKPGSTIIEATAGNTGIGIAFAALGRGYQVIFVVPEKFSLEKQLLMKALGARIIHTPRADGMQGAMVKAEALLHTIPDSCTLGQFVNPANPEIHFQTTGPEIDRDMDGKIDYLIAGAGSGGTYSGIVRYLKSVHPSVQGVLADPVGSILGGGEHADYAIEGIGNDFIADTMDMRLVDRVIKVNDIEAFRESRQLAAREGIFAGSSSGAAVAAARRLAESGATGNLVVILPDRGDRYLTEGIYGQLE